MAVKIVQKIASINIATSGGISTSVPIPLKTGFLRVTSVDDCYVEVGPNPGVSTSTSLFVPAKEVVVIKEEWGSKGFDNIIPGATTTIVFPQGTGGGFRVGEVVSISGCAPVGLNTNFTTVISVDDRTSYDSYHNTRLVVDWNTSGVGAVTDVVGELRKVTRIAAYNSGAGPNKIHITEIQPSTNI
jgi:hypothetical protein